MEADGYRSEIEPAVGFGRLAILVDSKRLFDGAERMVAMLELGGSFVTESEAEAKRWVGLPPDLPFPYESRSLRQDRGESPSEQGAGDG